MKAALQAVTMCGWYRSQTIQRDSTDGEALALSDHKLSTASAISEHHLYVILGRHQVIKNESDSILSSIRRIS